MKKHLLLSLLMAGATAATANAQSTNYALDFTPQGVVNLGTVNELDNTSTFALQLWFCPTTWDEGAQLLKRGDALSVSLGASGTVNIQVGNQTIAASSNTMQAGRWAQLTLTANANGATVLVNNQVAATTTTPLQQPTTTEPLMLGGAYNGRIDEVRIYKNTLGNTLNYQWQNTLNEYAPQWGDLAAYYKMDQYTCPNIVDYTNQHHGTMSAEGVQRSIVTDNDQFKYLINAAYCDWGRFADRAIDMEKFRLSNVIILLVGASNSDGHAWVTVPDDHGTVTNASYEAEKDGRTGVLHFKGDGAEMNVGNTVMQTNSFSFGTWIYIDQWKEGAEIMRKTNDAGKGIVLSLGSETEKCLKADINGYTYQVPGKLTVGEWHFVGITPNANASYSYQQVIFAVDSWNGFAARGYRPTTAGGASIADLWDFTGVASSNMIVGRGFTGWMDNTVLVKGSRDGNNLLLLQNNMAMPDFGKIVDTQLLFSYDGWWKYDKEEDLGYDTFSYTELLKTIKRAYDGYRGYKLLISIDDHSGWQNTFASAAKRETLATDIANIANNIDEIDGIDMDFEWAYNDGTWNNYADLMARIRQKVKPGKLVTISPHQISYRFPVSKMDNVDYFFFQIYGPNNKGLFTKSGYTNAYNAFVNWGYPKEKIVMSYATTTSGGAQNGSIVKGIPPTGIRNLFGSSYTPDMDQMEWNNYTYYFTGYNQTIWRTQQMRDNNCGGIFYWDMGNDVSTSHPYSLPKAASLAISSNVDKIVESVDNAPAVPTGITGIKAMGEGKVETMGKNGLRWTGEPATNITLFDATGTMVASGKNNELSANSSLSGTYIVKITTREGKVITRKQIF